MNKLHQSLWERLTICDDPKIENKKFSLLPLYTQMVSKDLVVVWKFLYTTCGWIKNTGDE